MKRIICLIICIVLMLCVTACGAEGPVSSSSGNKRAVIRMPDGVLVEGKVDRWYPYQCGLVEVEINGTTFTTHGANVVLITK